LLWHPVPQKSSVVPQNPNCEQQTFNGQSSSPAGAFGPHWALASQFEVHGPPAATVVQNGAPYPQYPESALQQAPLAQGMSAVHEPTGSADWPDELF